MQTLKTAVVVVLLLFVIYGAFVAINGSNTELNPEIAGLVDLDTNTPDISGATGPFVANSSNPSGTTTSTGGSDPWAQFNSKPTVGFNSTPATSTSGPTPSVPPSGGGENKVAGTTLATLDPASLPPLPPLPPIVEKDGAARTNDVATSESSDDNTSKGPTFGLAIPPTKNNESASESPSLAAATTLPPRASNTLPNLPSASGSSTSAAVSSTASTARSYENAKELATEQASRGQLKEALATLSVFYNSSELTAEQRSDLVDMLDALSAEVIYSREHHLEMAYFTAAGETLEQIAKRFEVPTDVLARINGLEPTGTLISGTRLKAIPGPFRAEVDLTRNELTLFLGELYAGRFPISIGTDPNPKPGVYAVLGKDRNRNYYGTGTPIAANDPRNPYGGFWIDLGDSLCIHGASDSASDKLGCISLAPGDAADVFGMLSSGSQVTIKR